MCSHIYPIFSGAARANKSEMLPNDHNLNLMLLLRILVLHIIRLHQVLVLGVFFNFFGGTSLANADSILYGLTSRIYLPCDLL
jgi:hypothetical protein